MNEATVDQDGIEELEPLEAAESARTTTAPKKQTPLFLRLTRRAVIFLFLMLSAFIGFYIAGCAQSFLDADILLLLSCITSTAILLFIFSLVAFFECLITLFTQRRIYFLFYALPFAITTAISFIAASISHSIHLLSRGL